MNGFAVPRFLFIVSMGFATLIVAAGRPAAAAEPETFGPVLTHDNSPGAQRGPAVAFQDTCPAAGSFFTVYQSFANLADNDIWGRYTDTTGTVLGAGPLQMTFSPAEQRAPSVAANTAAGGPPPPNYLVVWMDNSAGNWDIWAQLWDCAGVALTPALAVTADPAAQRFPDVACGELICSIVWEDNRAGNWDIWYQPVNAALGLLGPNLPLTTDVNTQQSAAVAYDPAVNACSPADSFLTVWQDSRLGDWDIFGQEADAAGPCPVGNLPTYVAPGHQRHPDLAFGTLGQFYQVAWEDSQTGDWEIFANVTNFDGAPASPAVNLTADASRQVYPAVAYDEVNDRFLNVWQDFRSGNWDIFGQETKQLIGPVLIVLGGTVAFPATPANELMPAVAHSIFTARFLVNYERSGNIRGIAYW